MVLPATRMTQPVLATIRAITAEWAAMRPGANAALVDREAATGRYRAGLCAGPDVGRLA